MACRQRETLPRSVRIRSRRAFIRVFNRKCRASDRLLTVYGAPNDESIARIGISVGRRAGSAVQRNRVKRLLREAFRRIRHGLPPGIDYVFVPRPGLASTSVALQNSIRRLADRVRARLADSGKA